MAFALKALDLAAASIFATAAGVAASLFEGGVAAAVSVPVAFALAYAWLSRVGAGHAHRLPQFELAPLPAPIDPPPRAIDDRIVRLFDPRQLRIARSSAANSGGVPPDAGQALSDALAQLKRSLR